MGEEQALLLCDTHCHLSDARFDVDRAELLAALLQSGLRLCIENATSQEDWDAVGALGQAVDYIYVAYGVHPHSAAEVSKDYLSALEQRLDDPKCVAVGEIGLDYHYDFSPRDVQKRVFIEQIELAIAHDLPIVVHDREAHQDILEILGHYKGKVRGEMHCYSGSAEMLRQVAELDFYLGFGGTLTFKKATRPQKAASAAPLERLLIETDCPYLTPEPFRGRRNDPSMTRYVCEQLAQLRGLPVVEMAQIAYENACRLFGIMR